MCCYLGTGPQIQSTRRSANKQEKQKIKVPKKVHVGRQLTSVNVESVDTTMQRSPEADSLGQSLKLARRNASAGLQTIMHATNALHLLFMSTIHDSLYNEYPLVAGKDIKLCCGLLLERHECLLGHISSIINIVRDPVCVVVERGFSAIAALRG